MIISEARNKYSEYGKKLNKLEAELSKKRDIAKENAKLTNDKSYFDEAATLELSISDVDEKIKDNKKAMEELNKQWQLEYDAQLQKNSKKKSEKSAANAAKVMEVARRIAAGESVPCSDEKKLMDYNSKLYFAVKQAGAMARINKKRIKKYKSLWEQEEENKNNKKDEKDPAQAADNATVQADFPDMSMSEESQSDSGTQNE